MEVIKYDFHIHSCLSPCGDDEMTPANIIGMAQILGLEAIALTDHNSTRNCAPTIALGLKAGITVLPGMELTTSEEVHVVCLFSELSDATAFDEFVYSKLLKVPNNPQVFGNQFAVNEDEEVIYSEPNLLINATSIQFHEVYDLVSSFHGIMIPAHIDKSSFSLLSNLGFVPEDSKFTCVELKELKKLHSIQKANPYILKCNVISDSDAHALTSFREADYTILAKSKAPKDILEALINVPV